MVSYIYIYLYSIHNVWYVTTESLGVYILELILYCAICFLCFLQNIFSHRSIHRLISCTMNLRLWDSVVYIIYIGQHAGVKLSHRAAWWLPTACSATLAKIPSSTWRSSTSVPEVGSCGDWWQAPAPVSQVMHACMPRARDDISTN